MSRQRVFMRVVRVEIEVSSDKHCSNCCPYFTSYLTGAPKCGLLPDDPARLVWDKRKRMHGYKRTAHCRRVEIPSC